MPPDCSRGRAVAMLALVVLAVCGRCLGAGAPRQQARNEASGGGRAFTERDAPTAAFSLQHGKVSEQESGMIIEDEGDDEDGASGHAAVQCADMEFPEQMMAEALALAEAGSGELGLDCLRTGAQQSPPPDFAEYFEALATLEDQHGDAEACREALLHALELDPDHAPSMLKLGNWYAGQGQDEEAVTHFRRTSQLRPDSPVPFNNVGLALMRMHDAKGALTAFQEGLDVAPDPHGMSMLLNNMGIVHKDSGDLHAALDIFQKAQDAIQTIEASINIASTLNDLGRHQEGEEEIRRGLAMQPHVAGLRVLASCLALQDRLVEAAKVVLEYDLDASEVRRVLSEVAFELAGKGKGEEAVELMSAAAPALSEAEDWYHLGLMLVEMHRNRLGMRAYHTALRLDAYHERCLSAAAVHLYKLGRHADAEHMFRRQAKVSTQDLDLSDAYNGMGAAIEMTHSRLEQSVVAFRESVRLNPDNEPAFFSLIHLLGRICDWREYDSLFARAREFFDRGSAGGLGPIFALAFPLTPAQMCVVLNGRAREAVANLHRFRAEFIPWSPDYAAPIERLGLAVVSADFNVRPVGQLVQSLFQMMDRARFEVFCFMLEVHDNSQVMVNIANSVDEWFWVKGLSPLVVAQMVNNEQPHVIIDLNGFTDGGRAEIGALKPAPVSVNYLGFPYSLSIPGYDYILSDRVVLPPEQHGELACFTERVAWLPNMYMVNDHRQSQQEQIVGEFSAENATNYSVPHRDVQPVFANFNHLQKLGPGTFALWVKVLLRVPGSVLWLLKFPAEAKTHLEREIEGHGIPRSRLHLSDKFASAVHLNVKRAASVLLDTLEYNAHVSGLDALWAGLPLVTMAGSNMARRCGASFLRTSRVPQLLARTPDEYVALAVRLATDAHTCTRLRRRVEQERVTGRLFDTKQWVEEFQVMLRSMWEVAAANGGGGDVGPGGKLLPHLIQAGYTAWQT